MKSKINKNLAKLVRKEQCLKDGIHIASCALVLQSNAASVLFAVPTKKFLFIIRKTLVSVKLRKPQVSVTQKPGVLLFKKP
jgi:hypothetical protein